MASTSAVFERVRAMPTRAAKRRMIELALTDPAVWAMSDRWIAQECELDPRTIWKYRQRVGAEILDAANPLGLDAGQHAALISAMQRGERIGVDQVWQPYGGNDHD